MTYMFENPVYHRIVMPIEIEKSYRRYSLYSYCEGVRCESHRRNHFTGKSSKRQKKNGYEILLFKVIRFCSLLAMRIVTGKFDRLAQLPIEWAINRSNWIIFQLISMKNYRLCSAVFSNSKQSSLHMQFERF